jgi:hypothetical protein
LLQPRTRPYFNAAGFFNTTFDFPFALGAAAAAAAFLDALGAAAFLSASDAAAYKLPSQP